MKAKSKSRKAKDPEIKRPKGRPSDYSAQIAENICSRIGDGESLRHICTSEDMPDRSTVLRWVIANEVFRDQYARAREFQADKMFDEILTIADTPMIGEKTKTMPDGKTETIKGDMIEHRRLQVDARKWTAARLAPKKYGDRVTNELIGDKDNPLISHHVVEIHFVSGAQGIPA